MLEASDGEAAWKLLMEHRPAVAVLDINMPGRTGLELTEAIRAESTLADTRVLLLSGDLRGDEPVGGADRAMRKPFSPAALLAAVRDLAGD